MDGPCKTYMSACDNSQKAREWALRLEEDLAEQHIPKGALEGLAKREGFRLPLECIILALAADHERQNMQPDSAKAALCHTLGQAQDKSQRQSQEWKPKEETC